VLLIIITTTPTTTTTTTTTTSTISYIILAIVLPHCFHPHPLRPCCCRMLTLSSAGLVPTDRTMFVAQAAGSPNIIGAKAAPCHALCYHFHPIDSNFTI
jgi:hypothetical protein